MGFQGVVYLKENGSPIKRKFTDQAFDSYDDACAAAYSLVLPLAMCIIGFDTEGLTESKAVELIDAEIQERPSSGMLDIGVYGYRLIGNRPGGGIPSAKPSNFAVNNSTLTDLNEYQKLRNTQPKTA